MAFFDEAKKNINQVSQSAMQKTKDLSEIAKLNSSITECENKIRELYSKIGYETYRAYIDAVVPETEPLLMEVSSLYQTIDANRNRINELNAAKLCPNCGAKISKKHLFCGNCGYRFAKPEKKLQRICPNCRSELADDSIFCSNCGTKVTE